MIDFIYYSILFFSIFVLAVGLRSGFYLISSLVFIIMLLSITCLKLLATIKEQEELMEEILTASENLANSTKKILDDILKIMSKKPVKRSKKRVVHA